VWIWLLRVGRSLPSKLSSPFLSRFTESDKDQPISSLPFSENRFAQYAKAMMLIEKAGLKSKSEADKMLAETEPVRPVPRRSRLSRECTKCVLVSTVHFHSQVLSVRQFLLTNSLIDPLTKTLKFRIPLDILHSSVPAIGDFPFAPGSVQWDGPTLALKGKKARYITERNEPVLKEFFPRARVVGLDTGHWVHAERPGEFVELVREFVEKKE
jgi:pimeloyl-ACP methyl ester carboxylesterase